MTPQQQEQAQALISERLQRIIGSLVIERAQAQAEAEVFARALAQAEAAAAQGAETPVEVA